MMDFDAQMEEKSRRQADIAHEQMMVRDESYALDMMLPQVIDQLEGISRELEKYDHQFCVRKLIHRLKDY